MIKKRYKEMHTYTQNNNTLTQHILSLDVSDQLKSSPKIERTALSLLYCQAEIRQRGGDCQRTYKG